MGGFESSLRNAKRPEVFTLADKAKVFLFLHKSLKNVISY
jgi:hypothetical protein